MIEVDGMFVALIKKIASRPIVALLFLFFLAALFLVGEKLYKDRVYEREAPAPIATVQFYKPTKEFPSGSMERWRYKYGFLKVDRRYGYARSYRLPEPRLFAATNVAWPHYDKMEERYRFIKENPDSRLRILFFIQSDTKDIRTVIPADMDRSRGVDKRYPGFLGYAYQSDRKPLWIYIGKYPDLIKPDGGVVTVRCSSDESYGIDDRKVGHCSYILVFDDLLHAQVRFNKPLMHEFSNMHSDLVNFLHSFKE